MKASERIRNLIMGWEGCKLTAYRCPGGVLTIGYGHTGSDVTPGLTISQQTADELFDKDLARVEDELQRWMHIDGVPRLRSSTLWRKVIMCPSDPSVAAEFRRWVNAGGKRMPGLVRRREQEARIYYE